MRLKNIVLALLTVSLFLQLNLPIFSHAEECEVGNLDVGDWVVFYSDTYNDSDNPPTHTTCEISGNGTLTSYLLGRYTYELIQGDKKLEESFRPCGNFTGTGCLTICKNPEEACAFYEEAKPEWFRTWPPCITSDVASTGCDTTGCFPPECHVCAEGMIASSGIYWSFWPAAPYVTKRIYSQWVCKSCMDPSDNKFEAKATECGGVENIINWDNVNCTGECDECPNDPNKTEPGTCGCGVPDTDTDGDGTPDCNDECPDDPNKTEPGICGCGVPETTCSNLGPEPCPQDKSETSNQ